MSIDVSDILQELADRPLSALLCLPPRLLRLARGPRAPRVPPLPDPLSEFSLALPTPPETPDVSVVIPVYGQAAVTLHCLRSIAKARVGRSLEVIVVDDRSPDVTPQLLERVSGIRVARPEENGGFIRACRRGGDAARGRFLVFLNNDTVVTDGWLDALIWTIETLPGAGIVGARLLYPNGQVQEVGGIVFRDGSGAHFHRRSFPSEASDFAREVDYVSGACLALRTEDWRALGGFDERYLPAYYEDTDLCFRMRALGKSVWVQPAAEIFHLEGATHGRDLNVGIKRHQVDNHERFFERWQETLKDHPVPGRTQRESPFAGSRRRGEECLVLGLGGDADLAQSGRRPVEVALAIAAAGFHPVFYAPRMPPRHRADLQRLGVEVLGRASFGTLRALLRAPRSGRLRAALLAEPRVALIELARRRLPQASLVGLEPVSSEVRPLLDAICPEPPRDLGPMLRRGPRTS